MKRKSEPIEVLVDVRYIDKNTLPPDRAAAWAKARLIFERIFRVADEKAKYQVESRVAKPERTR